MCSGMCCWPVTTMQTIVNDYGLDEIIRTFKASGEVEPGLIWLQVKATDHPQTQRGTRAIEYLRQSVDKGVANLPIIKSDPDLDCAGARTSRNWSRRRKRR
jgi:hypothetical protein